MPIQNWCFSCGMQFPIVNGWQKVLHLFDTMSGGWVGCKITHCKTKHAIPLCNFFNGEKFDQKNTELCRCFLVIKISMRIFNLKKSLRPKLITRNLILSQKYNLINNDAVDDIFDDDNDDDDQVEQLARCKMTDW